MQTTFRSITGAESIGVAHGFVYSGSTDVQHVLQDLDRAIQHEGAVRDLHINRDIAAAHPNGMLPMNRISDSAGGPPVDLATQTELDAEARALSDADTAHADLTTGVHGVDTGYVVGTTNTQTLTNKTINGATINDSTINNPTITGGTISGNVGVNDGIIIDSLDVGSHNHTGGSSGVSLRGNANAIYLDGGIANDDTLVPTDGDLSSYPVSSCEIITSIVNLGPTAGIDAICMKTCREGNKYRVRCWHDGDEEDGTGCPIGGDVIDDCTNGRSQGGPCQSQYILICVR